MAALHISISAEPVFHVGNFTVTNSIFTGLIVTLFLLIFSFLFSISKKKGIKPGSRLQTFVEMIIEALYNLTSEIAGPHKARFFFPLIASFFMFILFNNWIGLLPGVGTIGFYENEKGVAEFRLSKPQLPQVSASEKVVETTAEETALEEKTEGEESTIEKEAESGHGEEKKVFVPLFRAATADINTTIALAIVSVLAAQFYGIQFLGLSYFKKFFNFSSPIFTYVGLLELVSEFAKIISFAFRLFGNIFAGEVLLAVIAFLVPVIAPMPFIGLEIFVGLVQALVFSILTLVFINMATTSHEH